MKEMNIDALLADYMKNPKWAGKIFMQDEKTCYIDGLIAGAKAMQEENEQLKAQIKKMQKCLICIHFKVYNECSDNEYYACELKECNNLDKWELAE